MYLIKLFFFDICSQIEIQFGFELLKESIMNLMFNYAMVNQQKTTNNHLYGYFKSHYLADKHCRDHNHFELLKHGIFHMGKKV